VHDKYPCPCCGYLVFDLPPGYHEVCPICLWEDDLAQLRFPRMPGSANRVSLERGQQNFAELGTAERLKADQGRPPDALDRRDPAWRPLDPRRDRMEEPRSGVDYRESYPRDTTRLYYWRSTFWHPQIA
jgi:hypothetical protein